MNTAPKLRNSSILPNSRATATLIMVLGKRSAHSNTGWYKLLNQSIKRSAQVRCARMLRESASELITGT